MSTLFIKILLMLKNLYRKAIYNIGLVYVLGFYSAAVRAQTALPRTGMAGMRNPRRRAPFRITPARWRSSGAPKNACVFWGRPNLVEPAWPSQGLRARALFALWVVFEAAVLIYGDVYDTLKLFPQKARGSRGRDPEEPPRGGGDERPRAC